MAKCGGGGVSLLPKEGMVQACVCTSVVTHRPSLTLQESVCCMHANSQRHSADVGFALVPACFPKQLLVTAGDVAAELASTGLLEAECVDRVYIAACSATSRPPTNFAQSLYLGCVTAVVRSLPCLFFTRIVCVWWIGCCVLLLLIPPWCGNPSGPDFCKQVCLLLIN